MNSVSANRHRYDLSPWLIHFTRPVNLSSDDAPVEIDCEGNFGEDIDSEFLSPFFLLRRILRKRQILATWSIRGGRPTIYGPHPAVCFTEMPLGAFLDSSVERGSRGEHISPYAIILDRDQVFAAGGRPVIYGLSDPSVRAEMRNDGTRRFPPDSLPEGEQYRYVAFNPNAGRAIDWSHEREWRWLGRHTKRFCSYDIPDESAPEYKDWSAWNEARENDRFDGDGLCLDVGGFEGIGFLVKNARQTKLLSHDILRFVDEGRIPRSLFRFILQLDLLPKSTTLIDPVAASQAIESAAIPMEPLLSPDPAAACLLRNRFEAMITDECRNPPHEEGELGGCWLWLMDNTHPLTRALLAAPEEEQRIRISKTGRYLVWLPELGDDGGLRFREELTKKIANRVQSEFAATATYYSVLNSDDVDGIPSYTDDWDEIYMSYANDRDDY